MLPQDMPRREVFGAVEIVCGVPARVPETEAVVHIRFSSFCGRRHQCPGSPVEVVSELELEAKVVTDPAEEELTVSEVGGPMVASRSMLETLIGTDIVAEETTTSEVEMEAVVVSESVAEAGYVQTLSWRLWEARAL